ncbi:MULTISPECIES: (2Fe-2S)-binding protein [Metabacillus]|jgi:xanthine dehydrogenase E subunit|uniref:(2Fe-2S)-binding protein n=1 Tax=Metabacillus rhizolycopersici TaxID=2875709 RepID=A0ABS7UTT1_9BACI|nr:MULTISPECIES: (2Fe-2S)-binding protein [Metabacillus]MBZ5751624.1 (2Fe-2S)-binding protein [Metabacillus rhizolycopersici]MCM3651906.1 (2Fe-2S)-binding protein [Metabacillus litoralis]
MTLEELEYKQGKENAENKIKLNVTINGQLLSLSVPPTYRLVDLLRKELGLTGTKISCEIGRCGACSVLMNGTLVNACLVMAYQINGTVIETIEHVAQESLHPIQQAFLEEGALQCGYCTPGMVIALKSLLDINKQPTEEEVLDYLTGNLCRCTGYNGILRAVQRYKDGLKP